MNRRIPYSAKGKGIAREDSPPLRKRIRIQAPDLDTSDLIQENSLTLIGRLTNPTVQRLWSLIPFLFEIYMSINTCSLNPYSIDELFAFFLK